MPTAGEALMCLARFTNDLFKRYAQFLSDSRTKSKASKLYIFDSTTISLFQEVLRTGGKNPSSGKRKGGIKVHTLIRSDQDVPCMIRYSSAVANDSQFLKEIHLPKGSVIAFDRGYYDFNSLNRFTEDRITWVTRLRKLFAFEVVQEFPISEKDKGFLSDQHIILGHRKKVRVKARLIRFLIRFQRNHLSF